MSCSSQRHRPRPRPRAVRAVPVAPCRLLARLFPRITPPLSAAARLVTTGEALQVLGHGGVLWGRDDGGGRFHGFPQRVRGAVREWVGVRGGAVQRGGLRHLHLTKPLGRRRRRGALRVRGGDDDEVLRGCVCVCVPRPGVRGSYMKTVFIRMCQPCRAQCAEQQAGREKEKRGEVGRFKAKKTQSVLFRPYCSNSENRYLVRKIWQW